MAGFCIAGFPIQPLPNPPTPPIPPTSSVIVPGTFSSANTPNPAIPNHVTGASVGDLLVAFMNRFNAPNGYTMVGHVPAGWTVVREDMNPGTGSLHGQMYTGIATKIAVTADTSGGFYSFDNSQVGNNGGLNVTVCCVHTAVGIDATSYSAVNAAGALTVAGASCAVGGEIVLVAGFYGTGSGSVISSTGGLPFAGQSAISQANVVYYQTGPGAAGTSASQQLTCFNGGDAFSGYQVSITA